MIIPLYNLAGHVAEAIESALAQTVPVEVIVVDDGSTDASAEVAARFVPRIRYVRQANRGLSAARNAGLRLATCAFVQFLDADDRMAPDKTALQLAFLDARPDVDLVYCGHRCIGVRGEPLPQSVTPRLDGDVLPRLLLGNILVPHAVLVRRAAFAAAGEFDERLTSVEDWDVWLRIAASGRPWGVIPRILADYRVRPDAMHQNPARMTANRLRVLGQFLQRPDLAETIRRLRPLAFQHAYLASASEHLAAGYWADGLRWFRLAARARPHLLVEEAALRQLCLGLVPFGFRTDMVMAAEWRRIRAILRHLLAATFADAEIGPAIAHLRRESRRAAWNTVRPWLKRRARVALSLRSHRARFRCQRAAYRAFAGAERPTPRTPAP